MDNKRKMVNEANSSQMFGSRFLDSFSQSNTNRNSVIGNAHLLKKPKLDIDKQTNLFGSNSANSVYNNKDLYDDIWGEELDSTQLEQVDEALSQIPESSVARSVQPCRPPGSLTTQPAVSHQQQTTVGHNTKSGSAINRAVRDKSKASVPLRRVASSGWPSSNTFSPSNVSSTKEVKRTTDADFLPSGFGNLQIENEKLREELNRKTGEANLVRDRLKSIQLEYSKQKTDYLEKLDAVKHEAETNIAHLSKEIKSLKGQLDVKNMEIETAERRSVHLNSVNRLNPDSPNNRLRSSIRAGFSPARAGRQLQRDDRLICARRHTRAKMHTVSFELLQQLVTPELLMPTHPEPPLTEAVRTITNSSLISGPAELRQTPGPSSSTSEYVTARRTVEDLLPRVKSQLSEPCALFEPCRLYLLSSRLLDVSSEHGQHIVSQVLNTCNHILMNQLHQLESAACSQNRHLEREREVVHCRFKNLMLTENYNLLSSKELYNNERGLCARRALVLLSLLVETSDFAAEKILPRSSNTGNEDVSAMPTQKFLTPTSDSHKILSITKDIVCQIEKQRRTLMFEGVLAAAMALIKSLLLSQATLTQHSQEMIVDILRWVVFARPGSFVIHYVLRVLLAATRCPEVMDRLCHSSAKKTFAENHRHSIVTYTPDSCILQVLCSLLQLVETPKKHVLSDVFTSWVVTLFYGSQRSPRWLFSAPTQRSCQCRPLVSRLTFTLLGEACCVYPSGDDNLEDSEEKELLEKLLIRGILLVSTLLYHDEHFGANVDPASVGYYELFLHYMNTFDPDIKLNTTYREILEGLCIQEALRQPTNTTEEQGSRLSRLLSSLYCSSSNQPRDILHHLDSC